MKEKRLAGKALLEIVRALVKKRRFRIHPHCKHRQKQRAISIWEMVDILQLGSHEPSRDEWDLRRGRWKYAIRGHTLKGRQLRVVVTIVEENDLLLLTVYET